MADLALVFDILARDKASNELNRVGETAESTGKRVVKGLGVIAGGLAAIGVTAFVAESIQSLQRIERINAATEAVIRSTGGAAGVTAQHIEDYAGALENATATEAESIQQGANLLATFTNVRNAAGAGNAVFDDTVSIANDMARALDKTGEANLDVTSTSILLGKALNDPVRGLSALTRVGVSFTEQQREQIAAFVESGDVMSAQKVILAELNKEFGGAGEAFARSTAGKVELAEHALGTFGETILANTLPALADLAQLSADGFNAAAEGFENGEVTAEGFDGAMQRVGVTVGDVADTVGFLVDVGGELIEVVDAIPGPVLAGVGAMAGFAALKGPVGSALETVYLKGLLAADGLKAAGGAGGVLRTGLGGLVGFLGGPVGIALGAAAIGVGFLTTELNDNDAATDAAAAAARTYADAIREANGVVNESVRQGAAKAAQDADLLDVTDRAGISAALVTDALTGNAAAYDQVRTALLAYQEANTTRRESNLGVTSETLNANAEAAQGAAGSLETLANTLPATQAEMEQLARATDEGTTATGSAQTAADLLAASQQQLADDTNAAKQAVDAIRLALDQLGGQTVNTIDLESALYAAVDEAAGAMKDLTGETLTQAGTLNTHTEAGRAAADVLGGIRNAGLDLIANQAQLGESTDQLTGRSIELREQFINAAQQMNINEADANALADQYGLIPGDVVTTVQANTGQASGALDGLFAQINRVAQDRVASIQFRATLSDIIGNLNPFSEGGYTGPGGRLTPAGIVHAGEIVWSQDDIAAHGGVGAVESMRRSRRGYADGGLVTLAGLADTASASASIGKLADDFLDSANAAARAAVEPATDMARGLAYARSQVGKPYLWGSAGPAGFDCSGFMAAITNVIRGANPNTRLGSTATFPWSGFASGSGMFTIGSTPNAGGGIGHMAGTILGVNVESRGKDGVVVGSRARGSDNGIFTERAHLATYDDGGLLQPGYTLAFNGTGKPEPIRTAEQEAALHQPAVFEGNLYLDSGEFLGRVRGEAAQIVVGALDVATQRMTGSTS